MKKPTIRTTISLLLCLLLVLGMAPVGALAAEETVTGPQLNDGTHTEWRFRLDYYNYRNFVDDLRYESSDELLNPDKETLLENGDHAFVLQQYTGNPTFTYDANAEDPDSAANEAAVAAIEAAIAEAGNHDLATVTSYATAIYSAFLQDYPGVFWLSGDLLVDEVLTYDASYEAGEGTASYTQTFYFYLTKADGSFDVRAENYREGSKAYDAYAALLRTVKETISLGALNNCSRYEMLLGMNQLLTEINEYNTCTDLSTISHDCRTALSALNGATGTNGPVSEGYARAFMLLCEQKKIPCVLVTGLVNGQSRTWNYVRMEDGNWYAVDVAMNDPATGFENAKYFLVGSTTEIDGIAFSDSHVVTNVVTEGGLAFTNGPALSESGYVPQSSDLSSTAVYINGKDVNEIDAEDDTISWNPETNTLTLNNASILAENGTYKGSGIYTIGNDTIVLELVGENTVEGKYTGDNTVFASSAISTVGNLIIRGDGSLTATDLDTSADQSLPLPRASAGIYSGGNLTIEGGVINATGRSKRSSYANAAGIISGDYDTPGVLTVTGGTVNATGHEDGIAAFGAMYISGGDITASTPEDQSGSALCINSAHGSDLLIGIQVSGGTLTLNGGSGLAVGALLNCSSYKNAMFTTVEGGPMTYGIVPTAAGLLSNYLRIEPADLLLVQPNAQNQYTAGAEILTDAEITVDYRWYQEQTRPITDKDLVSIDDYGDIFSTYDEAAQQWTFPSALGIGINYLAFATEPGTVVTVDFGMVKDGLLLVITGAEVPFTPITGSRFCYSVTEADIDPETGLFMFAILNENELKGTVHLATTTEVQTTSGTANRLSCDNAGTYFCRATVSQNGTVKGTMESNRFDYLPSNTVTFDANGGTCETETAETQSGVHTLAQLPEPTRTGYTFTGWTDADGNPITTDTLITEDITLYAQWSINEYTLTVEDLYGVIYQEQIAYGTDLEPILSGLNLGDIYINDSTYTFTGTFVPAPEATMPAEALTLKAVYTYTGWMEEEGGTTYLFHDKKAYFNEWVEMGVGTFYFDADSHILRDITLLNNAYYAFDHETGKFLDDYTGIYEALSGDKYYVENGVAVANKGLVKDVLPDGTIHYYYFGCGDEACTNGCDPYKAQRGVTHWVENNNGYLAKDHYTFDIEGRIILLVTDKNGVYYENGAWYYYEDNAICGGKGLIEVKDMVWHSSSGEQILSGTIYVRTGGKLATGFYWTTNTNGLIDPGYYEFDANGILCILHGIVEVDGTLYYYQNDVLQTNVGLIQHNGEYYYVRSNGIVVADRFYWITRTNDLLKPGYYEFDASGKMILKKGIIEEDGALYYYIDGVKQTGSGLIQLDDGAYIYVRTNGKLATGAYWITTTNGLLPQKSYNFGTDGKLYL